MKVGKKIPDPSDPIDSIPPPYSIQEEKVDRYIARVKTDTFYYEHLKPWEELLTNPAFLKKITLGQLGSYIEFTVHNWVHVRWSDITPLGFKPDPKPPYSEDSIDKKWDDVSYDWMADTYSSHVHPLFWKLHGWVDARVEDWKSAHDIQNIRWKGTWERPLSNSKVHDHDMHLMHKAIGILVELKQCSHFYDERQILPLPKM